MVGKKPLRLRTKQTVLKKRVRKTRPIVALKPWLALPGSISVGLVYPGLGASLQGLFRAHIPAKIRFAIDDGAGHAANVYNIDKTVMWPTDYDGDEQARFIMHEKVRPPVRTSRHSAIYDRPPPRHPTLANAKQ